MIEMQRCHLENVFVIKNGAEVSLEQKCLWSRSVFGLAKGLRKYRRSEQITGHTFANKSRLVLHIPLICYKFQFSSFRSLTFE